MRKLLTVLFALLCVPALLHAQPAPSTATATFLDRTRTDAERLKAAQSLGYPDEKTRRGLLGIGADKKQSDAVRFEALRRVQYSPKWRDVVLKILADPNDGGEELDANLIRDLSRKTAFRIPVDDQQRIQKVERKLLDDQRDKVRLEAYRALVSNHDSVALERLVTALRIGKNVPIPLTDAIELLDDDGAISYIGVLRPFLDHRDAAVRARAARALALDPESRPKIVEMAVSSTSPAEVRVDALGALAHEDPGYTKYAVGIVANGQESPDIRRVAMGEVVGRMNYNVVDPDEQIRFAQTVERVAGDRNLVQTESGALLQRTAVDVLAYLKKAFPAIAKFYANR